MATKEEKLTLGDKVRKGLFGSSYYEKEEVFDYVFWFKHVFSLVFGLVAGSMHFTGLVVIIAYVIGVMLTNYLYYTRVLKISDDDYGQNELAMEGMQSGFALFMLSWILTHTFAGSLAK